MLHSKKLTKFTTPHLSLSVTFHPSFPLAYRPIHLQRHTIYKSTTLAQKFRRLFLNASSSFGGIPAPLVTTEQEASGSCRLLTVVAGEGLCAGTSISCRQASRKYLPMASSRSSDLAKFFWYLWNDSFLWSLWNKPTTHLAVITSTFQLTLFQPLRPISLLEGYF